MWAPTRATFYSVRDMMEIHAWNKEWPLKPEFKGKNLETEVAAFIAEVFMQAKGNDRSLFTRIVENRGDLSFSNQKLIDLATKKFLASDAMAEDAKRFQECCDALMELLFIPELEVPAGRLTGDKQENEQKRREHVRLCKALYEVALVLVLYIRRSELAQIGKWTAGDDVVAQAVEPLSNIASGLVPFEEAVSLLHGDVIRVACARSIVQALSFLKQAYVVGTERTTVKAIDIDDGDELRSWRNMVHRWCGCTLTRNKSLGTKVAVALAQGDVLFGDANNGSDEVKLAKMLAWVTDSYSILAQLATAHVEDADLEKILGRYATDLDEVPCASDELRVKLKGRVAGVYKRLTRMIGGAWGSATQGWCSTLSDCAVNDRSIRHEPRRKVNRQLVATAHRTPSLLEAVIASMGQLEMVSSKGGTRI